MRVRVVLALLLAAACGDSGEPGAASSSGGTSSGGGSSGDAGADDGGGSSSGGDAGPSADLAECQRFAPTGAEVVPTRSDQPPAASTGGTITDGTYQLVAVTLHDAEQTVPNIRLRVTLQVAGDEWRRGYSIQLNDKPPPAGADSGTFVFDGSQIGAVESCEDGAEDNGIGAFSGAYSATPEQLILVQDAPAILDRSFLITYVLQKE